MTAETDERIGDSQVSEIDIDEKISSNLSSCEDLEKKKVSGESNDIVHEGEDEIDGSLKEDGDGSYVFVTGSDTVSDDLGEKVLGYKIDESVVSSSTNDVTIENSHSQPKGKEVEKNDEQNKTTLALDVEGNDEKSVIMTTEADDSDKKPLSDRDEVKQNVIVPLAEVESDEVDEIRESITDNEEKVVDEGVDSVKETEEQIKPDSATEVKENQESENLVKDSAVSKGNQLHSKEEEEEEEEEAEEKLESAIKEEKQESEVIYSKDVGLELGQLDNREGKDPEDNPSGGIRLEESETGPVNTQLEAEAFNGSSIESGTSLPSGPVASETEVINDLAVGNVISEAEARNLCVEISENMVKDSAVSKGDQLLDGEEEAEEKLEFGQLDNGEEKDPEDNPSEGIRLESETGPVNTQLEAEAFNGSSIESGTSLPSDPVASETEVINDLAVGNMISKAEARNLCVEISESLPFESNKMEAVTANGSTDGVESRCTCNGSVEGNVAVPTDISGNGKSEDEISNGSVEGGISVPTYPAEDSEIESETMNGSAESSRSLPRFSVKDVEVESEVLNCSIENGISLPTCHVADVEQEQEPEAGNGSGASGNAPSIDAVNLGTIAQDGLVENGGTAAHSVNDVIYVENEGMQSTSGDSDGKPICQEVDNEGIQGDEGLQSSPEGSTADAVDVLKVDPKPEVVKNPFHFLIKIPRYVDNKFKEHIRLAQLQVEEKTQSRDAMGATIQMKRATCTEYRDKFEAAKSEERIARDALSAKRQEIDSVQSAISIDDNVARIHNMEHMLQHETMPLKEEKQLIRDIKILREQLSSQMGRQDGHQQASNQRDRTEERLKLLKQELDSLRKKVLQTEGITKAAKEKYFDENENLRKLQSQFKVADDLRQEAYAHLQNLRKELYEKNKYFRMYKDEVMAANDYASSGDREALQRLCVNQVEAVMELWNKNDEFRKEYIRCNTMSTLRRLTTLDGRSLGPDEEPPVIHNVVDERVDNVPTASSQIDFAVVVSPSKPEKSYVPGGAEKGDVKSLVRVQQENATAKLKKVSKPTALENRSAAFSGREEKDDVEEENKKSKAEEELARKAEELRKEEAAVRLTEQRRLEEKAKAKEAEERKRRNAEKAQARAELKAQREAELKEKEREKRAKKKEKKKAAAAEGINVGTEGESAPSTENTPSETTAHKTEIKEKTTLVKRPQKPSLLAKQSKTKPLPPPLRNRGKRRMQTWMWLLIVTLLVLALFFLGSIGISFKFGLPSFGF